MTSVKSDTPVFLSGQLGRSRVALALSLVTFHSRVQQPQVVSFGSSESGGVLSEAYFEKLLSQGGCQKAWDDYTKTAMFPSKLADGTAPLNGFRHYMLQDAIYLEYYVRVRMEAIAKDSTVSSQDILEFVKTIPDGLIYSQATRSDCNKKLGIPEKDLNEKWSTQLTTSINNYETVIANAAKDKDSSWLDIHFALLPCIKGYYTIAETLCKNPATKKNTPYYTIWIQPNTDKTFVDEYDAFIRNNIGTDPTPEQWTHWGAIFKQACINELSFFSLGTDSQSKYEIVSDGTYAIRPFVYSKEYLTTSTGGATISSESAKWELKNFPSGYTIKFAENRYLGVKDGKVSVEDTDSTKWSINPVFIPLRGNITYRLSWSEKIQLVLDVKDGKVSLEEWGPTTKTWILDI